MNAKKFEKAKSRHTMTAVISRLPWCDLCKEKDKSFAGAGRKGKKELFKEYSVTFGVIDAREEPVLARDVFNTTCDEVCPIHIFKEDEPDHPYVIKGVRYQEEIMVAVYKHLLPLFTTFWDQEGFDRIHGVFDTTVFGFFPDNSTNTEHIDAWRVAARELRGEALFAASFDGLLPMDVGLDLDGGESRTDEHITRFQNGSPVIVVAKPKENRKVWYEGELTASALMDFSKVLSTPLVGEFDMENRQKIKELNISVGQMFLSDDENSIQAKRALRRLARRFPGALSFVNMNATRDRMFFTDFGVTQSHRVPWFGISQSEAQDSDRFLFRDTNEDGFWDDIDSAVARLSAFCQDFVDGNLEPARHTQELNADYVWAPGTGYVHHTVWTKWKQDVERYNGEILLEFYSPQRKNHHAQMSMFHLLADTLRDVENLKLVAYDASANHIPDGFKLSGNTIPSMFMGPFGGEGAIETEYYFLPRDWKITGAKPRKFRKKTTQAEKLPVEEICF